jgi:predicted RND superfamily exporter protein
VIGLSVLAGVNLTAFSDMSFVLSVGFAVEYAVHVVHRVIKAPMHLVSAFERVEHTMSFLALPTFMSFVSSTIGVVCLAFTNFDFNTVFFFRPLIITMAVTYFYGCWLLPVFLCGLNFECLKLGKNLGVEFSPEEEPDIVELKAVAEQPLKEIEHDDEEHFA